MGEPKQLGLIAGEKPLLQGFFFLGVEGTLISPLGGGVTHFDGSIPTAFILLSKQSRSVEVNSMGFTLTSSLDISPAGAFSKHPAGENESYEAERFGKRVFVYIAFASWASSRPAP